MYKTTGPGNRAIHRREHNMNTEEYLRFIRQTLFIEGMEVADKANKIALERREISVQQYSKAAKIIAAEILKR